MNNANNCDPCLVVTENSDPCLVVTENSDVTENSNKKRKRPGAAAPMKTMFCSDLNMVEIGIDEAGRGPMFGRVYAAAVVLPKNDATFKHEWMKDSKTFHSKQKIERVAEYIRANAVAWSVAYEDEIVIDRINVLQATQSAMHRAIADVVHQLSSSSSSAASSSFAFENVLLLVDGDYFKPYVRGDKHIVHELVTGGDRSYTSIAAASILAKVARDAYIGDLCAQHPELSERYGLDKNKGYGTKQHLDGIRQHGITPWHRKTFGICSTTIASA